jgi:hypothetical protein
MVLTEEERKYFEQEAERRSDIAKIVDKNPVCDMNAEELQKFISFLGGFDHTVDENDWSDERWEAMRWKNREPPKNIDDLGKKLSKECVDEEMGWELLKICVKNKNKECVLNAERTILFALLEKLTPFKEK